jgi:hypothetical protein
MNTYLINIDLITKNFAFEKFGNYLNEICEIVDIVPAFLPPGRVALSIKTKNPIPVAEMLKLRLGGTEINDITPGNPAEKVTKETTYVIF